MVSRAISKNVHALVSFSKTSNCTRSRTRKLKPYYYLCTKGPVIKYGKGGGGGGGGVLNYFFIENGGGGVLKITLCERGVFGFFPTKGLFLVIY
jgi:hypothetical protein